MKITKFTIFFFLFLIGCGPKTYFESLGDIEHSYDSRPIGCPVEMFLYYAPSDRQYDELGICTGSYHAYSEKSYDQVIRAIKDCACEIGGNAIVYSDDCDTYGYDFLGQVTDFKTTAKVLYLYETDYIIDTDAPEMENIFDDYEYDE